MNKEKLEELAAIIEKQMHYQMELTIGGGPHDWNTIPQNFSMKTIFSKPHGCQSVGCILGYGLGLDGYNRNHFGTFATFCERFSLPMAITKALCDPSNGIHYQSVTPKQAAQAIRNVIAGKEKVRDIWEHVIYQ